MIEQLHGFYPISAARAERQHHGRMDGSQRRQRIGRNLSIAITFDDRAIVADDSQRKLCSSPFADHSDAEAPKRSFQ